MGFSQEVINEALRVQEEYKIPASVTLATYALESGWGTSRLATQANNFFGLSGSSPSGQFITASGRKWQKYDSMAAGFDAYGRTMTKDTYTSKTGGVTNVTDYVNAIAETYAPSSDGNEGYSEKVLKIIRDYDLTQYDTVYNGEGKPATETAQAQQTAAEVDGIVKNIVLFLMLAILVIGAIASLYFVFR